MLAAPDAPRLKAKTLDGSEAALEAKGLLEGRREAVKAKGKAPLDSKQLRVDPNEVNF